jgi:hypothetical protein
MDYHCSGRSDTLVLMKLLLAALAIAHVVTDWDEQAVALASPGHVGQREMALVHLAIFDAVNSVEHRYRPYQVQLTVPASTSQQAAAAAAASTVLLRLHPKAAGQLESRLAASLAPIAEGAAKRDGIALGRTVAERILQARADDGADAPEDYRPQTKPGVYVPTASMVGAATMRPRPFVLTSAAQFRPGAPPPLASPEWAADYNEIKDYGGRSSRKRSARQTEAARFWLMVGAPAYHPIARQVVLEKNMSIVDGARVMALFSMALSDAYTAVFDAKYEYQFWRPLTAIRNGDIDGNPATDREATWLPLDNTPMHPEYPCAHCIQSGAATAVIEALLGGAQVPELSLSSSTAPGVVHRWRNLESFCEEVAQARIWAGFHYRFSTRVGTEMGRSIGAYVVMNTMQPAGSSGGGQTVPKPRF